MARLLLVAALASCVATNHAQRRKPPVAAYLVDFAAFSAGACVGLDAQYRSRDTGQLIAGYGTALGTWLSWWTAP